MLPDRHVIVPPGKVMRTGYVSVFDCVLACRERMAVGDVDRAFQKLLQLGDKSQWPCPNGRWRHDVDGKGGNWEVFVIEDGRHEWMASVMLGRTHLLVAWMEDADGLGH